MVYGIRNWRYESSLAEGHVLRIKWECVNPDAVGANKAGNFGHTLDGAKTWDANVTDIEKKIAAEEGMYK